LFALDWSLDKPYVVAWFFRLRSLVPRINFTIGQNQQNSAARCLMPVRANFKVGLSAYNSHLEISQFNLLYS
jgi:hypothetical protein